MEFDQYAEEVKLTREQKTASQREFGGAPVYIPKVTKEEREARDMEIVKMFYDQRMRLCQIAQMTGLSLKQIRRIVYERK
jgi:DNA invertase Pin-like site-specific DNA recombinase